MNWFGKKKQQKQNPVPGVKLTRKEKKQINAILAKAHRNQKGHISAQETIPYQRMWQDGICRVGDTSYSKTILFEDINYQLGATRSHTNITPQGAKLCGRLVHVVLKMGGFRQMSEATTYTLMSGMMG